MAIRVPSSFPITMTDIWSAVNDHTSTATKSLALCYSNAISGYFDPTYYVSNQTMGRFRNYGPPVSVIPTVITTAISSLTPTTAISGGNVTSDGGAGVIERGVCWSASSNPTIINSHTSDGTGTGSFASLITGLSNGMTYYTRAYATNSSGTGYGNEVIFTTGALYLTLNKMTIGDGDNIIDFSVTLTNPYNSTYSNSWFRFRNKTKSGPWLYWYFLTVYPNSEYTITNSAGSTPQYTNQIGNEMELQFSVDNRAFWDGVVIAPNPIILNYNR